jgi:membrane-associated phospholipid phosphatase
VDRLFTGYLAAVAVLIAFNFREVPDAPFLLAAHALGIAAVTMGVRYGARSRPLGLFRHWYPLAYIPICYKEMAVLIPAIRNTDFDAQMASFDYRFWGAHPTVWLERFTNPWVTECLQVAYTLFIPSVILVAAAIWLRRPRGEFRYYAFLVTLGFLASYVGYFLIPVRGPRFFLAHLQHIDLHGVWLFDPMQRMLDHMESAHYDCFPSGHTEMTLVAWWSSRRVSRGLFGAFWVYAILIVSATVYLRYHYTVDVFAGIVLAAAVLALAPRLCPGDLAVDGVRATPSNAGASAASTTSAEVFN